jgi:hypothetical protein
MESVISTLLLIVAVLLFVLAATRLAKAWFVPIGLACFAASFLVDGVLSVHVK